jgi:hypothetical protein
MHGRGTSFTQNTSFLRKHMRGRSLPAEVNFYSMIGLTAPGRCGAPPRLAHQIGAPRTASFCAGATHAM